MCSAAAAKAMRCMRDAGMSQWPIMIRNHILPPLATMMGQLLGAKLLALPC